MTNTVLLMVVIAALIVVIGMIWLDLRLTRDRCAAELDLQLEQRRRVDANHLLVMKALKGDSYQGQVGELELHTDPVIPPETVMVSPKTAEKSEPARFAAPMVEAWHGKAGDGPW